MANIYDYLAFRGDLTLAERPFNDVDNLILSALSYLDLSFVITEAQRQAARYLEDAIALARRRGRMLRVGGHSKGGNLAEFAAVACSCESQCEQILCVYSNDGPCMAPEVAPVDSREVLGVRLRRIVPTFSVVGMLFAKLETALNPRRFTSEENKDAKAFGQACTGDAAGNRRAEAGL